MPTWTTDPITGCTHPQDQIGSIDVHGGRFSFYCKQCKKRLGLYNQKKDIYTKFVILPPIGKTEY